MGPTAQRERGWAKKRKKEGGNKGVVLDRRKIGKVGAKVRPSNASIKELFGNE